MNESVLLSVITPTYNRGHLLRRCYNSLINQTSSNFEWIIIDDGSVDNTKQIVSEFINEEKIKIKYFKKENSGKHKSLNYVFDKANGVFTLILDSDDYLDNSAVEIIKKYYGRYETNPDIGGFTFLKANTSGEITGKKYHKNEILDYITYPINRNITGDKCEVFYTKDILRYKFPDIQGEKFIGESVLWIKLGLDKKIVYVNQVIYYCEYLDGGLTKEGRKLRVSNPIGGMLHAMEYFKRDFSVKLKIKNGLLFNVYRKISKIKKNNYEQYINIKHNFWTSITVIPSMILYLKWKKYL